MGNLISFNTLNNTNDKKFYDDNNETINPNEYYTTETPINDSSLSTLNLPVNFINNIDNNLDSLSHNINKSLTYSYDSINDSTKHLFSYIKNMLDLSADSLDCIASNINIYKDNYLNDSSIETSTSFINNLSDTTKQALLDSQTSTINTSTTPNDNIISFSDLNQSSSKQSTSPLINQTSLDSTINNLSNTTKQALINSQTSTVNTSTTPSNVISFSDLNQSSTNQQINNQITTPETTTENISTTLQKKLIESPTSTFGQQSTTEPLKDYISISDLSNSSNNQILIRQPIQQSSQKENNTTSSSSIDTNNLEKQIKSYLDLSSSNNETNNLNSSQQYTSTSALSTLNLSNDFSKQNLNRF